MKKYLTIITACALAFASSCTTHYFPEPQPIDAKSINEMPKPIIGQWDKPDEGETHFINKTSWVSISTDSLGNRTTKREYTISDSLIVKKVDKFYFINMLEDNNYWMVMLGHQEGNNFYIKGLGDEDTLTLKSSLGITPDSTTESNDLFYRQSLTKNQMKKLVKDGGFADTLMVFDLTNKTIND